MERYQADKGVVDADHRRPSAQTSDSVHIRPLEQSKSRLRQNANYKTQHPADEQEAVRLAGRAGTRQNFGCENQGRTNVHLPKRRGKRPVRPRLYREQQNTYVLAEATSPTSNHDM